MPPTTQAERSEAVPGLLLVGHGTRYEAGRREFLQTVDLVRARLPQTPVEPAFLELCQPGVEAAVERMAATGTFRIVAAPVLLLAAAHARQDIPRQLEAAARCHPQVEIAQAPHLGCHGTILQLSADRFYETLRLAGGETSAAAPETTALLIVGRGTSDAQALAELREFVRLRVERTPVARVQTCFLAVARPSLEEGMAEMAACDARRIVVQPHLLFQGELLDRLGEEVAAARRRFPEKEWHLAGHLGPDELLAEAIAARYLETAARSFGFRSATE